MAATGRVFRNVQVQIEVEGRFGRMLVRGGCQCERSREQKLEKALFYQCHSPGLKDSMFIGDSCNCLLHHALN